MDRTSNRGLHRKRRGRGRRYLLDLGSVRYGSASAKTEGAKIFLFSCSSLVKRSILISSI